MVKRLKAAALILLSVNLLILLALEIRALAKKRRMGFRFEPPRVPLIKRALLALFMSGPRLAPPVWIHRFRLYRDLTAVAADDFGYEGSDALEFLFGTRAAAMELKGSPSAINVKPDGSSIVISFGKPGCMPYGRGTPAGDGFFWTAMLIAEGLALAEIDTETGVAKRMKFREVEDEA